MADALDRSVTFLREVCIPVREASPVNDGFLPGVRIGGGGLVFDRAALHSSGDLLHEAGHIAVMPAALRTGLSGALPAEAPVPFAGEDEAIAWSWAALVQLGLPAELLFHERGYRGQAAALRLAFAAGVWPGAFGLAQAGLAQVAPDPAATGDVRHPRMARWLRG